MLGSIDHLEAERIAKLANEDEARIVQLCLEVGNLRDYCGDEIAVAEAFLELYREAGLESRLQPISPTSANVLGVLRGSAPNERDTTSLILNSHLDTEGARPRGSADERKRLRGTWQEDDLLIGKGLINAKCHLVAQLFAVRALQRAEISLKGDVILAGSAQETGRVHGLSTETADDWTGPHILEGAGAQFLVDHGVVADYALVGEPTGLAICPAQAGYLRLRINVEGMAPYTPFVAREDDGDRSPNPFERSAPVIAALAAWAHQYEREHTLAFGERTLVPKAQIQEIRAGSPAYTELTDWCEIFLDVRTPPGTNGVSIKRDLARRLAVFEEIHSIECYDYRRGYVADGADLLVEAIERAHREVFNAPANIPHPSQMSMCNDTNAFNQVGIPAVAYGIRPVPETYTRERIRACRIADLVSLVQVYALSTIQMCRAGV